jgi:hypothetical protein
MRLLVFFTRRDGQARRRRGSLLIEASIGLTLIAIVLLGMMIAFTMSVKSFAALREKETSTFIAVSALNEAEGVEFVELVDYLGRMENSFDMPGYSIAFDWKFSDDADRAKAISADITVTVKRRDGMLYNDTLVMKREVSQNVHRNAGIY